MTNETLTTEKPACYCGSKSPFLSCCQPLLTGAVHAETAEQLMRSRYSAFCTGNDSHLIRTLHPDQHHHDDVKTIEEGIAHRHWVFLSIISTSQGKKTDDEGTVEFIARFKHNDSFHQHHELSTFVKEEGQWFYVSGEIYEPPKTLAIKLGRNTNCWCGSGKKFKKCHG